MEEEPSITIRGVFIIVLVGLGIIVLLFTLIIALAAGYRQYSIWSKEQQGRAALAEAKFSKQVKIEEAKADLEAQKLNAEAELVRAQGAAKSIQAEAGTLTENYIRYLWVRQQDNLNQRTVVYIPTEAGLPILEANRLPGGQ